MTDAKVDPAAVMRVTFTARSLVKNGGVPYWSLTHCIEKGAGWVALQTLRCRMCGSEPELGEYGRLHREGCAIYKLQAAEIKMLEDNWRFDDAMDAVLQARQAEARASQAEQRLREIRKLAELNNKSWWGVSELFALLSDPPAGGK